MFKKLILSTVIGLTLQVQAENSVKTVLEAKQPTVTETSHASMNQLVLNVGAFDPLTERLDFSKTNLISKESKKYRIVQFENGHADSTWLRKQGFQVVSYLANNAFIVVAKGNTEKILSNNKNIRWHGRYHSAFKVSPELWRKNLKRQVSYDIFVAVFKDFSKDSYELLLRKFVPEAQVKEIYQDSRNGMVITLKNNQIDNALQKLSQIDEIQYIELIHQMGFFNAEATAAVQSNLDSGGEASNDLYTPINTPIYDKGLFGTGQIVGVADSGLDSNEDWFAHYNNGITQTDAVTEAEITTPPTVGNLHPNNKVIGYFVMPGAEAYDHGGLNAYHGTHVSGSVAGDRILSVGAGPAGNISSPTDSGYDNDDGMAPNAQLLFQDIGSADGLTGSSSSPMWEQAYTAGVRIHSNSYGSSTNGQYSFSDLFADKSLRQFEDMLILFSAGNDGASENTIGSPGTGKNITTVGALAHANSPFVANFSSRGPTDDGRIKPDIMATGARIESASGNGVNTTTITAPARKPLSGTSMATPITAGASALMRQFYTEGFYPTGVKNAADNKNPSGPLMKATLINGAGVDGGHFNKDVGWGRVFLSNSLMFDDSDKRMHVWEVKNANGLKTGESMSFKLGVKADQPLAITLVWYDLPGPFGSSKTLINDIDLEVKVNGQVYKGNVFNASASSGTGGNFDRINTVEQVRLPVPSEGLYTITVNATNIPGNEEVNSFRQGFALVATGNLDNISTPGILTEANNLTAQMQGDNGIKLNWDGGANADFYEIYKAEGSCTTADFKSARIAGVSENNDLTDFRTLKGTQYAYRIRAGQYGELGKLSSECVEITSNQFCDLLPEFFQSSIQVIDNLGDSCHTKLQWSAATSSCSGNNITKYNIYRSNDSDFVPSAANLLTSVSVTNYDDIRAPDAAAYYIVRAVDSGGNTTVGTSKIRSQPVASSFISMPLIEDVDNIAIMNLSFPWQVVSNKAADGVLSYKTGEGTDNYPSDTCAAIVTNTIPLTSNISNPSISYKALYDLAANWDGVVVEISTDDGATWADLPPNGGYPGNFSESDNGSGGVVNACGYAKTHGAFNGSNGSFQTITHDLSAFSGQNVKVRWQLSSDPGSEFEGFYIDSINYPNVQVPNSCTVNTTPVGPADPTPGLYSDADHNGHGFVIEPINDELYFTVFYSYNDDGTSQWFTQLATLVNGQLSDKLNSFSYDYAVDPTGANTPLVVDDSVTRSLMLDFNASAMAAIDCVAGSTGVANWSIGADSGQWCIKPIVNAENFPTQDFGGTWWTGIDDDGWGLSLTFSGDLAVATVYYFDAEGNPRWVQAAQDGFVTGQDIVINMKDVTGYARTTTPTELVFADAGTLTLNLSNMNGNADDGTMSINVTYQGSEGGTWSRTNMPLQLLSQPH